MTLRAWGSVAVGLMLLLSTEAARADHKKLHDAIVELKQAKDHLGDEKKHEKVVSAHRALKEAIKDVKDSKHTYGGRRTRLIERLEHLDKQLEHGHVNARKSLEEAIEDLEFANKH